MTTLDHSYRQYYVDMAVIVTTFVKHIITCKFCKVFIDRKERMPDLSHCKKISDLTEEVEKRMESHKGFLDVVKSLKSISSWYKPSPDEPSVMHGLSSVINHYEEAEGE